MAGGLGALGGDRVGADHLPRPGPRATVVAVPITIRPLSVQGGDLIGQSGPRR